MFEREKQCGESPDLKCILSHNPCPSFQECSPFPCMPFLQKGRVSKEVLKKANLCLSHHHTLKKKFSPMPQKKKKVKPGFFFIIEKHVIIDNPPFCNQCSTSFHILSAFGKDLYIFRITLLMRVPEALRESQVKRGHRTHKAPSALPV